MTFTKSSKAVTANDNLNCTNPKGFGNGNECGSPVHSMR